MKLLQGKNKLKKTNCVKGDVVSNWEILDIVELAELNASGIYAKHTKTATELFHIYNDDEENLFAYTFKTAPENSSGVAHILEHSVLCGSKNYPLKDPFAVLGQGSLQTYLNAWTFPDKTVYPASSVNEEDYFNLMSVYGDAVFFPLLDEWTFMQEGHRLEFENKRLAITGVVYNEMKGAYSALDEYAQHWALKCVLPDTPYAFDSGGDPECIPQLSYDEFIEFYKRKYAAANCKIFLCGNIPVEKQLALLDTQFFSKLPAGEKAPPLPLVKKWRESRVYSVAAPSGGDDKQTIFISWLLDDALAANPAWATALSALTEVLLGHDGSPLMRVLIESSLGEDLASVSGLEIEIREPVWAVGLRGVATGISGQAIEDLIFTELKHLVSEGIPEKEVRAALLAIEFSQREIKRSGGPWALVLLRRALRGWLHGAQPWETLIQKPGLEQLKNDISNNARYFEEMIQKLLIDNPHRATVVVRPEKDFIEKQNAALEALLCEKEKAFSKEQIKTIKQKSAELEKRQEKPDSPEDLLSIPHIKKENLSGDIDTIPRELFNANGIPVLSHKLFTNGISYCDFAFPFDVLSPSDYVYMPLFFHCISAMGIPGMDYAEVSSLLAQTIGDFYAMPHNGSMIAGTPDYVETPAGRFDLSGRDWMIFRLKTLDEKIDQSVELALRTVKEADFGDLRRLHDLVLELKTQADSSLAPHGNIYASTRAARFASTALSKSEICSGLTQIGSYHKIAELDSAEISRTLCRIRDTLFSKTGMLVSITGEAEKENLAALEKHCAPFGPPRPRNAATKDHDEFIRLSRAEEHQAGAAKRQPSGKDPACEIFSSPSLQIGFAAMNLSAPHYKDRLSTMAQILAHYLSTGPLWEAVRMKGGAYGANAYIDALEHCFNFNTYRDPAPERSLETFTRVLKKTASSKIDGSLLEKTIIGTYSKIKQPHTALQKGHLDLVRFLYGVTDEDRARRLSALLDAGSHDLRAAAACLHDNVKNARSAIITSRADAEKIAKHRKLPVGDVGV
jgi:Zn-dependent M16 (insulinase) family peptidase